MKLCGYCYHSDSVISLPRPLCDHIKQLSLYYQYPNQLYTNLALKIADGPLPN